MAKGRSIYWALFHDGKMDGKSLYDSREDLIQQCCCGDKKWWGACYKNGHRAVKVRLVVESVARA